MASAHFSVQELSRGKGHSAVEASAYRARATLEDERTGETHDYSRHRSRCIFDGIYAPKGAPEWAQDRAKLWNHVEAFEKHRRAILAKEINIALPHELTDEQNRWLLQDWVKENVTRKGLIADVAIHEPDARGDARNIHAHVMIVMRKLDGTEFERSKERFDTYGEKDAARKAELAEMRASWERLANKHLERHGHEARIDMGRKLDGEPTLHMGKHATSQERRGEASELGDRNREIEAENARRQQQAANENAPDFTTTLDGIRQRERGASGDSRSTENEARRAMDDLARTDPLGTARHFGHHAGDRLKSPEDMRRENAERMRGFAAADPQPEPTRDTASPDLGRERTRSRSWTAQADGWDGLSASDQKAARQAFEAWRDRRDPRDTRPVFTLPQYVEYVQEREGKKRDQADQVRHQVNDQVDAKRDRTAERAAWAATLRGLAEEGPQKPARGPETVPGMDTPAKGPERSHERERERPGASYLQAALSAARERLSGLSGRLDATLTMIRERLRDREAAAVHQPQPQITKTREPPRPTPMRTAEQAPTQTGGRAREDTSSRKVNRDFADELLDEARRKVAQEAAASRGKAYEHDRHERERGEREYRRIRELIRQDRRARRPHEPN